MRKYLRDSVGQWPNHLAIGYAVGGYALALYLITRVGNPLATISGTLLLAHSLVIAGYLLHDAAHNAIFRDTANNARLGKLLNWLVGGSYNDYESIRHKHFRHHADKADVVAFDHARWLQQRPHLLKAVSVLEFFYIPAYDLHMHALTLALPFSMAQRRHRRGKVVMIVCARTAQFGVLAWLSPWALLYYAIAYMLMLHVFRFMDAFQHTYEVFETLEQKPGAEARQFDRAYEDGNTFSNLHSEAYPWLNLLTLNFAYHNAHHLKPFAPWYSLPAIHAEHYGEANAVVLPLRNQLSAYHRFRLRRITNAADTHPGEGPERGREFVGVLGVSFLTAH